MTALSPERVGRITGSRVSAILGMSPYKDRDGIMREMIREHVGAPSEWAGNIATEYGLEAEPTATAEYERYRGELVHSDQLFYVHRTVDFLGCTPDGLVGEHGMVEIKCPYRAKYGSIEDRPDYYEQVQLQLEVVDREWCDFVVWRPSGLAVSRVSRDPSWLHRRGDELDAFIAEYYDLILDPEQLHGYLEDAETVPVRDDLEWQLAALEYQEAKAAAERAERDREDARKALLALAAGQPARGGGVAVSFVERRGNVSYPDVVRELLPTVDLEPFRKPGLVVPTVRIAS